MAILPFWHKYLLIFFFMQSICGFDEHRREHGRPSFSNRMRGYRVAGKPGELLSSRIKHLWQSLTPSVFWIYHLTCLQLAYLSQQLALTTKAGTLHTSWLCGSGQSKQPARFGAFTHSRLQWHWFCSLEFWDGSGSSELEMSISLLSWNSWNIIQ